MTGDASLFTTIFYNDPRYPVRGEAWEQAIDWAGADAIKTAIDSGVSGPIGAKSGFLSAKIADRRGSEFPPSRTGALSAQEPQ